MPDDLEDYLGDEEDEEAAVTGPGEASGNSSAFVNLRQQLRAEKKARKAADEELLTLRPLREQVRGQQARDALKAAGLPEQMAGTFAKVFDGDLTEETARAFAVANGLASSEQEPAPEPFVPTVGGEAPGPKKVGWDEAMSMLTTPSTRDAALKLFDEGRVESR